MPLCKSTLVVHTTSGQTEMPSRQAYGEVAREWSSFHDSFYAAQAEWKDNVASQFAKQFMSEWEADIPPFLSALEALEEELRAAQRELS